jgi:hypothetical protein
MVADRKRRLRDGREFDHLFPPPGETDTTVKKSANVEDTMKLIRKALPQTMWQTEKIAKVLKGQDAGRNLFQHLALRVPTTYSTRETRKELSKYAVPEGHGAIGRRE